MSKLQPIDIAAEPVRFLQHADRIVTASNISAAKKQQWFIHHLGRMAEFTATGGQLTTDHAMSLVKLLEVSKTIQEIEAQERQREKTIAAAQKAAEEQAAAEAHRDLLTAWIRREAIQKQRELDNIREDQELAREANIRLNAIVYRWNKPRAQWFRQVQPLSRSAFMDYSYQGAD